MPPVRLFATAAGQANSRGCGRYLGWTVFGLAASWARAAIHASYSGVPRRGGTPGGMPPIHCGMSASRSPAVCPAHDVSMTHARHRNAQRRIGGNRFIQEGWHGNVAVLTRNQGRDGTTGVPLTINGIAERSLKPVRPANAAGLPVAVFVNRLRLPFAHRGPRNSYRAN